LKGQVDSGFDPKEEANANFPGSHNQVCGIRNNNRLQESQHKHILTCYFSKGYFRPKGLDSHISTRRIADHKDRRGLTTRVNQKNPNHKKDTCQEEKADRSKNKTIKEAIKTSR
jgi:hypothetical protein